MNKFINNTELVILTNAFFVFKLFNKLNFEGEYQDQIYYTKPFTLNEFNFFSNKQLTDYSFEEFHSDLHNNNYMFKNNLSKLFSSNKTFKPSFFHYNFQIHSTSVFVNYEKGFIIFFNSNKTGYYMEILKDICVHLNLIKTDLLKYFQKNEMLFDIFILNTGKQIDDAFCLIYTSNCLLNLLSMKKNDIDDPFKIMEKCRKITKADACCFLYYNIYLKNKKELDEMFVKRNKISFYKEFIGTRSEYGELNGVACSNIKECKKIKNKPIYHIFKGQISIKDYSQIYGVCFQNIFYNYYLNDLKVIKIEENLKCKGLKRNDEDYIKSNYDNNIITHKKRIINFFTKNINFMTNFDINHDFEYNLKELIKEIKSSSLRKESFYYKLSEQDSFIEMKFKRKNFITIKNNDLFSSLSCVKKNELKKDLCVYLNLILNKVNFPLFIEEKNNKIEYNKKEKSFSLGDGEIFYVSKFDVFVF